MTAPIVYKSTDGNAPVLNGTRTSMVALFKACLVDGFGDRPPAGWTMPFVNATNNRAVFRTDPTVSNGFFLGVDHVSNTGDPRPVRFQAAEFFSDLTSFSGGFGSTGDNLTASASGDTTVRPWIMVASPSYMYFFCWTGATGTAIPTASAIDGNYSLTGSSATFFFGDIKKLFPSDGFNTVFHWRGNYQGYGGFGTGAAANIDNYQHGYIARALTGAAGAKAIAMNVSPPVQCDGAMGWGGSTGTASDTTGLLVSKVYATNGVKYTQRGYLPNLLACGQRPPVGNGVELAIDGANYLHVVWTSYYSTSGSSPAYVASCLIKTSGDDL